MTRQPEHVHRFTDTSWVETNDVIFISNLTLHRQQEDVCARHALRTTDAINCGSTAAIQVLPDPPGPPGLKNTVPFLGRSLALYLAKAILATPALEL